MNGSSASKEKRERDEERLEASTSH